MSFLHSSITFILCLFHSSILTLHARFSPSFSISPSSSNIMAKIMRTKPNANQTISFRPLPFSLVTMPFVLAFSKTADDRTWGYIADVSVLRGMQLLTVFRFIKWLLIRPQYDSDTVLDINRSSKSSDFAFETGLLGFRFRLFLPPRTVLWNKGRTGSFHRFHQL